MKKTKQESGLKEETTSKRPSEVVELVIDYALSGGKLSRQLKNQGFKFDKVFIKRFEKIRVCLLCLSDTEIISESETKELFKKLNGRILEHLVHKTYGELKSFGFILTE